MLMSVCGALGTRVCACSVLVRLIDAQAKGKRLFFGWLLISVCMSLARLGLLPPGEGVCL